MKLRSLLLFFLMSFHFIVAAQLDYGKVKGRKDYCKKHTPCKCDSLNTHICNSKNELEIRVDYVDSNMVQHFQMLTYDSSKKWSAIVILDTLVYARDRRTLVKKSSRTYALDPVTSFENIYNELKNNNIFRLTDINEFSGRSYTLTYKAGDKIRQYSFPDPVQLRVFNPARGGMKRYSNIVDIFTNQFNFQALYKN